MEMTYAFNYVMSFTAIIYECPAFNDYKFWVLNDLSKTHWKFEFGIWYFSNNIFMVLSYFKILQVFEKKN